MGIRFVLAAPQGYQFEEEYLDLLKREEPGLELYVTDDPREAVREASFVYTDVWTSMGQEEENDRRMKAFQGFQVNGELMALAPSDAYFMHDLPARRGLEVTDEVMDGPQSVVIQQAANRLHAQKGILVWLLGSQN